jgi:hypothetical protein
MMKGKGWSIIVLLALLLFLVSAACIYGADTRTNNAPQPKAIPKPAAPAPKQVTPQVKSTDPAKSVPQVQQPSSKNLSPSSVSTNKPPSSIPVSWGKADNSKPYQCTAYVHAVRPDLAGIKGNPVSWLNNAKSLGFKTASGADARPVTGAVVVFQSSDKKKTELNQFGHVGVVKETGTDQKGPYLVMESANLNSPTWGNSNLGQGTPPQPTKVYYTNTKDNWGSMIKGYIYDK